MLVQCWAAVSMLYQSLRRGPNIAPAERQPLVFEHQMLIQYCGNVSPMSATLGEH